MARWLIVLGIAAAALILGYIGLSEYLSSQATPEFGTSWADIIFYDIQLFVLNSAPAQGPSPFPVTLGIARFLAPSVTALATIETLRLLMSEQLRRWSSATASKHAIVTGDGPLAVELARKLRYEYRKVVLISISPVTTEHVRGYHLLEVYGDPTDAAVLHAAGVRRANVLYACAELSATNAATALRAREISQARDRSLITFAQVRDTEICTALRARRIGAEDDPRFHLDFFSIEEIAARALLDKHPVAIDHTRPAQVVIVGFGRLGRAVLRELARRPNPDGSPLSVRIRGASIETVSAFLDLFPAIRRNCSVTCDDAAGEASSAQSTLILVCLPGNEDALNAGLAAAHTLTDLSDRVVICMSEPSPYGAVFTGQKALLDDVDGRLTVFEIIEEACVPDRIREDLADQLARAIHQVYVKNCAARGDSPLVNQSMLPWEKLPDDLKRSNFAQASHIGTKLGAINCAIVPESATVPAFEFTEAEIERLAQMEHLRWVQERQARGYVYGPNREIKQHPDLVDWQYLSEGARDKDRDTVRELPEILGQAGFQILRLLSRHTLLLDGRPPGAAG